MTIPCPAREQGRWIPRFTQHGIACELVWDDSVQPHVWERLLHGYQRCVWCRETVEVA